MRLNVIVPCFNPPDDWEAALAARFKQFKLYIADLTQEVGLIVVNDGASKNAAVLNFKRLEQLLPQVQIVDYPENRGKGYALRKGVAASEADFHLVTDTDFPYTLESMRNMVENVLQHGAVVAGNRNTDYYALVPPFRRWLSKMLRWVLRHVFRQPIDDSQCGLKAFDNRGKTIFLQTSINRFLYDLEFLLLAHKEIQVIPVPVELREGVKFNRVGWKIMAIEFVNLIRLMLRR